MANLTNLRAPWWSFRQHGSKFAAACLFVLGGFVSVARPKNWTEYNLGPFYVDTQDDPAAARDLLTQCEQTRWVLGNLLETKDLPSLWPIRILLTGKNEGTNPSGEFVWQNSQYLLTLSAGRRPPLDQIAGLLLEANTPRLPPEVESGLRALFATLEAQGSRVTWGSPPSHPDLAWARMQLFATKFEYGASFHIFLAALKSGSTLRGAERNALGKDSDTLEREAQANLAAGHWQAVPVSGRPLDPKRDFGEHSLDGTLADVFLADCALPPDRNAAQTAYKAAVSAGGSAAAFGYEGLGELAKLAGQDPRPDWEDAIRAGSKSAPVYLAAADGVPATEALPLLKRAAVLNPLWSEPIYRQAQFAEDGAAREALLKQAIQLGPRVTAYWVELAKLQTASGEATAAQGSWLRAENSAPTGEERDRVHQLRVDSEQQRLDAADELRRRDRDAVHVADQQAQQSESERIRAAEQKANRAVESAAGPAAPGNVVNWNSLLKEKKLDGTLTRVDCLRRGWRMTVKDSSGKAIALFLAKASGADLPCGVQSRPPRVSLEYNPSPDDDLHTAGEITSLKLQ